MFTVILQTQLQLIATSKLIEEFMKYLIKKLFIFSVFMTLAISFKIFIAYAEISPSREIVKAWAEHYIENRNLKEAIHYLNGHLTRDPQDAEALRLLGIAHRLNASWSDAEKALRRSAELLTGVERGAVLYLVADSQVQSGLISEAKFTLNEVSKISGLSNSAKAAFVQAEAGMTLPPLDLETIVADGQASARSWNLGVSISTAYDTNVLLLPDSQTAGLNPATALMTTGVQAGYSANIFNLDMTSNFSASYSRNFNLAAASFDNIPLSLGLNWALPWSWALSHDLSVTQQANATYVNTNGMGLFSSAAGGGFKGTLFRDGEHSVELTFPFLYNWYPGVVLVSDSDDRSGFSISPALSHRQSLLGLPFSQSFSYSHQFAHGVNFISTAYLLSASLGLDLPRQLQGNFSISISKTTYPQNITGRSDTRFSSGLDIARKFDSWIPLNTVISYCLENNSSTIQTASYLKHSMILKVAYDVQ